MDSEVEWTHVHSLRVLIVTVVALWASLIGPEFPGDWSGGPVEQPPSAESRVKGSGRPIGQDRLGSRAAAEIDREAFLVSYKRQARVMLHACLQSWRPSPGRATFSGVIHRKTGRLSNLEALGEGASLPPCVAELTSQMDFLAVTETMSGENIVLQWTAEW